MQDDTLLGTFRQQYITRLEAIHAGEEYGAKNPPHYTVASARCRPDSIQVEVPNLFIVWRNRASQATPN